MIRFALLFTFCAVTACADYDMAAPVDSVEARTLAAPDGAATAVAPKKHRKMQRAQ